MKKYYITIAAILMVSILLFSVFPAGIQSYNGLISAKENVRTSQSNIDIVYKKQFNLVDNIVNITKAYAEFEQETLENTVRARYNNGQARVSEPMLNLLVIQEKYPDLKTNEQFKSLSDQIIALETEVQAAKILYNTAVRDYTVKTNSFPTNILARVFKFNSYKLYILPDTVARDSTLVVDIKP